MRAFVFAIDHVKSFAATQLRKQSKQTEMKASGLILRKRREILLPPLSAWAAHTQQEKVSTASPPSTPAIASPLTRRAARGTPLAIHVLPSHYPLHLRALLVLRILVTCVA